MNVHVKHDEAWATEQVQAGIAFLAAESARQWEEGRAEREAKARRDLADWQHHAEQCDRRGSEYAAQAAQFPAAHRDHFYYLKLANEQFAKSAFAWRMVAIEQEILS